MKTMKKLIFLPLALALCPALRADGGAEALVRRMKATIDGYASYRIDFTTEIDGERFGGRLTVGGKRYALDVPDTEIRFDGTTRYTYAQAMKEVILEHPDPDSGSLLTDPTRTFDLAVAEFTVTDRGETSRGGRTLHRVELTPRTSGEFRNIVVEIDTATALPASVTYRMSGTMAVSLTVDAFTPDVPVDDSTFVFDPARHPGVETIDFR